MADSRPANAPWLPFASSWACLANCQVIAGAGMIRLQQQGLLELPHGFLMLALLGQHIAQVVMRASAFGMEAQHTRKHLRGLSTGPTSAAGNIRCMVGRR